MLGTDKGIAEKKVELVLKEKVPTGKRFFSPYWRQGKFYLNDQYREATVTDIKFISSSLLVAAHRAASKMYLIEFSDSKFTVIDTLILDTVSNTWNIRKRLSGRRFYHPDLMYTMGSKVYISEYSDRCCVVEIIDKKLAYIETIEFPENAYHGIFCEKDKVYLGSVLQQNITISDQKSGEISNLTVELEPKVRIKTIGKDQDLFVLAVDKQIGSPKIKGSRNNAWFKLFKRDGNHLSLLDTIDFPVSQVDGHIHYNGFHFVVLHDGVQKSGFIVVLRVKDNKLVEVKRIPCGGFPHGIDIRNDNLVYTTYSESSLVMLDINKLGLPE